MKNKAAIIKPLAKGQITIPAWVRKTLNINAKTIFKLELRQNGIFLSPLIITSKKSYLREFSKQTIEQFIADDKLDKKSRSKIAEYLSD